MYVNCKYLQCVPWKQKSWTGLLVDCSTKRFHANFMACLDTSEKQMFNAHFMNGLHVAWFLLQFGNWRKRNSKGQLQHHQQCFPQFRTFHEPLHAITSRECKVQTNLPSNKVFHSCSNLQHSDRPNNDHKRFHTCMFHNHPYIHKDLVSIQQTWLGRFF